MATVIQFSGKPRARTGAGEAPAQGADDLAERLDAALVKRGMVPLGYHSRARGSLAWARDVIVKYDRAFEALWVARHKAKEIRAADFPKPKFRHGDMKAPEARKRIADRMPNFDAEDLRIIAALKAYDAERAAWRTATAQIEDHCGVNRLSDQLRQLEKDYDLARDVIKRESAEESR